MNGMKHIAVQLTIFWMKNRGQFYHTCAEILNDIKPKIGSADHRFAIITREADNLDLLIEISYKEKKK